MRSFAGWYPPTVVMSKATNRFDPNSSVGRTRNGPSCRRRYSMSWVGRRTASTLARSWKSVNLAPTIRMSRSTIAPSKATPNGRRRRRATGIAAKKRPTRIIPRTIETTRRSHRCERSSSNVCSPICCSSPGRTHSGESIPLDFVIEATM